MVSLKFYAAIYVALIVLASAKFAFFEVLDYWTALTLTMVAAAIKVTLIAAYFQHLRWEPRSLGTLMVSALGAVLLLFVAASYSLI